MPTVTQVNDLKINKLTKAQYDAAVQAGTIGENEISIITDLDATPQVDSLPAAGASQVGKIYQYIGATDANYTNGYFYKCTEFADSATGEQTYGSGLTDISVTNIDTFANTFETGFGVAIFGTVIDFEYDGSSWMVTTEIEGQLESIFDQNIADWAVTFTGTPQNGDTISITYTKAAAAYGWENIEVQPAGDSLPDQTGNAGKFLTTDGTDASWSDKPLINKATGTNSVCTDINTTYIRSTQFGSGAVINGNFTTGVGFDTRAGNSGTAIGAEAYATTGKNVGFGTAIGRAAHANGNASIALGSWATANGKHSIQIGGAGGIANYDDNTMNVCLGESLTQNYKLLLSDGTIPEARLADTTGAVQGQVLTLDANGNAVWATPSSGGSVPTLTWYTVSSAGNTLTIADTSSAQLVKIYKNGLLLQPTEDYTISGTTLTTVSAMVVGDKITTEVF